MADFDRGDLWATQTTDTLHLSAHCCTGQRADYPRRRVRDHYNPAFFDDPRFKLCREAVARLRSTDSEAASG